MPFSGRRVAIACTRSRGRGVWTLELQERIERGREIGVPVFCAKQFFFSVKSTRDVYTRPTHRRIYLGRPSPTLCPPSSPTAVNASDRSTIELFSNFSPHPRRRHSQTTTSSHLVAAPSPPTPPTPSPLVPVGQDEAGPTPTSWRPASRWPRAAATTATAAGARRRRSRGRSPEERRLA